MLPDYTRCCYTMMRQMVERPKSRKVVFLNYLDWAIYIYAIRFYYIAPLSYSGFPNLPAFLFDWRQDPICYFFYRHRHIYDSFIPMIVFLMASFHMIMRHLMYNLNVNTLTWRWWYQLVVENQDHYYSNFISQLELAAMRSHREAETMAMLRKSRFGQLLPSIALVPLAKAYARFLVLRHLDHVNKHQLFSSKLSVLPDLSEKMRVRMLFTTIVADKVIVGVLFLSCELKQNRKKIELTLP